MDVVISEDTHGFYGLGTLVAGAVCPGPDNDYYAFVYGRRVGPCSSEHEALKRGIDFWKKTFSRTALLERFEERTTGGFPVRIVLQNQDGILGGVRPIEGLSWVSVLFTPDGRCMEGHAGWDLVQLKPAPAAVEELDLTTLVAELDAAAASNGGCVNRVQLGAAA